jgi:hypothetical protein
MVTAFGLPIPLDHPTIWYAAGGTGKSTLATALAGELERRDIPTLVADWETVQEDYRATATRIFGDDLPDIKYRRCDRPLVIEAESFAQQIDECGIRYVIIDSAGYAADGRPEDAEVALRYFRALRSLRVGTLTLAHVSSGEHGSDKPFGSVFWHNSARQTWYLERVERGPQDILTIGCFNKKTNIGRPHPAIGLSLSFDATRTTITQTSVAEEEQFAGRVPLWQRMSHVLKRGPRTTTELARELEAKEDSITKALKRGTRSFTTVPSSDGVIRWALLDRRLARDWTFVRTRRTLVRTDKVPP